MATRVLAKAGAVSEYTPAPFGFGPTGPWLATYRAPEDPNASPPSVVHGAPAAICVASPVVGSMRMTRGLSEAEAVAGTIAAPRITAATQRRRRELREDMA